MDLPHLVHAITRAPAVAAIAILVTGALLQGVLWERQVVSGDQLALLTAGWNFAERGELPPFAKRMSGGGQVPGSLLPVLIGLPLRIWPDYRAPTLLMGLSQLLAALALAWVLGAALGPRMAACYLAVYWLSPWRLYHSGFLWEPGFVFLPAALHMLCCHQLCKDPRPGWSALLAATLALSVQIHASFAVLAIATALLIWNGRVHIHVTGAMAGLTLGAIPLLPTLEAGLAGELPRLIPQRYEALSSPLGVAGNALKGLAYWFRLGSTDIGRRLRETSFLSKPFVWDSVTGLPALAAAAIPIAALVSVALAVLANARMIGEATRPGQQQDSGAVWIRSYTLILALSVVGASALSPVPVQGWHLVIALHAACLPTACWIAKGMESPRSAPRAIACGFAALQLSAGLAIALGHPMYAGATKLRVPAGSVPADLAVILPSPSAP